MKRLVYIEAIKIPFEMKVYEVDSLIGSKCNTITRYRIEKANFLKSVKEGSENDQNVYLILDNLYTNVNKILNEYYHGEIKIYEISRNFEIKV